MCLGECRAVCEMTDRTVRGAAKAQGVVGSGGGAGGQQAGWAGSRSCRVAGCATGYTFYFVGNGSHWKISAGDRWD